MKYKSIEEVKDVYKSVFLLSEEDDVILDILVAVTLSTKMSGDPIWLLIIGGSSSGKTELINAISKVNYITEVSEMTENTLLSSMANRNGKENSLLLRMGRNAMMTMKDYTSILSMRSEKRDLLISQLRQIYDGYISKKSGNGQSVEWKGKMTWIGAVTDVVYFEEGKSAGMGYRTINYVMPEVTDTVAIIKRASANNKDIEGKREVIQSAFKEFIEERVEDVEQNIYDIPEDLDTDLTILADFVTHARTPVRRDFHGRVLSRPKRELGMRVYRMLHNIAKCFMYLNPDHIITEKQERALYKLALDCVPDPIMQAIKGMGEFKSVTAKGLAQHTNMPTETARRWLEDLNVLGVCKRDVDTTKGISVDRWVMTEKYRKILHTYTNVKENAVNLEEDGDYEDAYQINQTWRHKDTNYGSDDPGENAELRDNMNRVFDELTN